MRKQIKQCCIGGLGAIAIGFVLGCAIENLKNIKWDIPVVESQESESESESTNPYSETEVMQIVMVGDMLMHEPVIRSGKQEDGKYNYDHLFSHVAEKITSADLAIANQETIMGGYGFGYTGYPSFNSPYELADA